MTRALAGIAVCLGVAISWPWLGAPARHDLNAAQVAEQSLRSALEQQQAQAANLDRYEAQLQQMQSRYARLLEHLPARLMLNTLLDEISEHALQNTLRVTHLTPQAATDHGFYTAVPVSLSVQGHWAGLYAFLNEMTQLSRMVTLEALEIRSDDAALSEQTLHAHLILMTYWQADNEAVQ